MALVVWSGGADSTLILYNMLHSHYVDGQDTEEIRTVSIVHSQVAAAKESRAARRKIKSWFKKKNWLFPHTEITVSMEGDFFCTNAEGFSMQPALWLTEAIKILRPSEDLYFGYIRGDDFWHRQHEFVSAYDKLRNLSSRSGSLVFPLEWTTKHAVLSQLDRAGLLDLIWYCEDPQKGKPCGDCQPCQTHESCIDKLKDCSDVTETKITSKRPRQVL